MIGDRSKREKATMGCVKHFRELDVYKVPRKLSKELGRSGDTRSTLSAHFPMLMASSCVSVSSSLRPLVVEFLIWNRQKLFPLLLRPLYMRLG